MKPFELFKKGVETNQRALILMCGLPNSGKSTLIKELIAGRDDVEVISRDDILMQYGKSRYGVETYSKIWSKLTKKDQEIIDAMLDKQIQKAQANFKHVIVDMTMLTIEVRRKMINKFNNNYKVGCLALCVSWPVILKRNEIRTKETGKEIPVSVLQEMWTRYKIPEVGESPRVEEVQVYINDAMPIAANKIK